MVDLKIPPELMASPPARVSPRRVIKGTLYTTSVLFFCLLAAAPFLVMGITTFQTDGDLYTARTPVRSTTPSRPP